MSRLYFFFQNPIRQYFILFILKDYNIPLEQLLTRNVQHSWIMSCKKHLFGSFCHLHRDLECKCLSNLITASFKRCLCTKLSGYIRNFHLFIKVIYSLCPIRKSNPHTDPQSKPTPVNVFIFTL